MKHVVAHIYSFVLDVKTA